MPSTIRLDIDAQTIESMQEAKVGMVAAREPILKALEEIIRDAEGGSRPACELLETLKAHSAFNASVLHHDRLTNVYRAFVWRINMDIQEQLGTKRA